MTVICMVTVKDSESCRVMVTAAKMTSFSGKLGTGYRPHIPDIYYISLMLQLKLLSDSLQC